MTEQSEFEINVFEDFIGLYVSPFCQSPTECYTLEDMRHSFNAGMQACAERKDEHKQEILGALLIGLDAAKEVAANYHQAMAGYRENKHKMLDDDVICIERVIEFLTGETE